MGDTSPLVSERYLGAKIFMKRRALPCQFQSERCPVLEPVIAVVRGKPHQLPWLIASNANNQS
jgi:hypothetical protein